MRLCWDGEKVTVPTEPWFEAYAPTALTLATLVLMIGAGHLEPTEEEARAFVGAALAVVSVDRPLTWESRAVEEWLEGRRAG